MRNFRMLVAYDGTAYRGWQRLGGTDNTIQGKIETVLGRMLGAPVEVIGSGRTDGGVHARGQVANFHAATDLTAEEILAYLRRYLPTDIGIMELYETDPRFHSRYSAQRKTYCYRVWNTDAPNVFERRYLTVVPEKLDVAAMQRAAMDFLGEHDFKAFCGNRHFKKSTVRKIFALDVQQVGQEVQISVTGSGFLYNMVRLIAGTLLEIGTGVRPETDIPRILESRDRENAGPVAPPKGLCLMQVEYGSEATA